ncbi:hypothetical protein [Cronobacter sakazakii]
MAWRAARILNVAHPDAPFELSTTPGVIQWLSRPETVTRQVSQPVNSTDY